MSNYIPDAIDLKIMNLLQKDGLMTYKEISGQLKKSMTNIVDRMKT
ncbi:AsnC family protein [Pedobacter agri]|nr:AsnC family protein [Pedobacter agri]